jgi:hypothetical protein
MLVDVVGRMARRGVCRPRPPRDDRLTFDRLDSGPRRLAQVGNHRGVLAGASPAWVPGHDDRRPHVECAAPAHGRTSDPCAGPWCRSTTRAGSPTSSAPSPKPGSTSSRPVGSAALIESLGCPSPRSRTSPASPSASRAGSRRCTRSCTPASSPTPASPTTSRSSPSSVSRPFELVVVNLYPFAATVASGATADECVEQIDIGGPVDGAGRGQEPPERRRGHRPAAYG